jgi:hypothetical protein
MEQGRMKLFAFISLLPMLDSGSVRAVIFYRRSAETDGEDRGGTE